MPPEDIIGSILRSHEEFPEGRPDEVQVEILRRMLEEGAARCAAAKGAEIEPPTAPDRFEGTRSLPEIRAGELDAETLGAGLLHHGGLLVRGLYDEAQVQHLLRVSEMQEAIPRKQRAPGGITPYTLLELLRVYEECGLLRAVRGYLGCDPVLLPHRTRLRMRGASEKEGGLPWHQDVNFFGKKSYAVNCWGAVTPCGDGAPGLSIIPRRTESRHGWREEDGFAPLGYGNALPPEEIAALCEGHPVASPVMQPGDAILFDEMTVHRTNRRAWVASHQLVTVTWFIRPAGFPGKGRLPLAI